MNARLALAAIDSWAMEPERLERMLSALSASRDPIPSDDIGSEMAIAGSVATIQVCGMLVKSGASDMRAWGMSATGYDEISAQLAAAAADDTVASIVLSIDSPGGQVAGCQALGDMVAACSKPTQAHVTDLCASAAYWIAAQCDSITANRSALVGSIGVYAVIRDMSRMAENIGIKTHVISSGGVKGMGVPGTSISADQLAEIKSTIDGQCAEFCAAISSGREISPENASKLADGRVHLAAQAQALGLIDHVSNSPQALNTMNIAPARLAALIKENPARASMIADLAVADKNEAEIVTSLKDAMGAELIEKSAAVMAAHEAIKAELAAVKTEAAAKSDADGKANAAALAEKDKALAVLQAKHDALAALAKNGVRDPGEQHDANAELPVFSQADASAGKIPEAHLKSGKYRIDG